MFNNHNRFWSPNESADLTIYVASEVLTEHTTADLTYVAGKVLAKHYNSDVPQPALRVKLGRTGVVEQTCRDLILNAHYKRDGFLRVGKSGKVRAKHGHHLVEAFAFELGRYEIAETLYRCLVFDMLWKDVYLLWIRSDVTFLSYDELFPIIGTYKDWQILKKCIARFSPKSCSHRYVVNLTE